MKRSWSIFLLQEAGNKWINLTTRKLKISIYLHITEVDEKPSIISSFERKRIYLEYN